jgi:outer membrane protein TolC
MDTMNRLSRLLPLALLVISGPGLAETLGEAWATAIASHRQIGAAGAMRDAAAYELEQARAARLPQLGLSSGYTRVDKAPGFSLGGIDTGPLFDGDDFVSAGAQIQLPLYTGGAVSAGIDAAQLGTRAAEDNLATVIQDIKLGVAEHYVGVLRAESAVTVATSYVASLESHTENTRRRYEVGDVPQNDYLAASVTLANAEQRLLQAKNGLDYAQAAYNRLLGKPLTAAVSLDPALSIDGLVPFGATLSQLIDTARLERRELAALDAQQNALRRQADSVRAGSRPQLALTGGYMYLENEFLTDDQFLMAGLGFTWNIFDGGQIRKRSAAIERKAAAIGHNRADLASMIDLQVRRAWNDRIEAESRLKVAESAVNQATENLRVVRNRYDAGASANVEVLDGEALREQALSNRDSARFELQLAKLRLARATGAL